VIGNEGISEPVYSFTYSVLNLHSNAMFDYHLRMLRFQVVTISCFAAFMLTIFLFTIILKCFSVFDVVRFQLIYYTFLLRILEQVIILSLKPFDR